MFRPESFEFSTVKKYLKESKMKNVTKSVNRSEFLSNYKLWRKSIWEWKWTEAWTGFLTIKHKQSVCRLVFLRVRFNPCWRREFANNWKATMWLPLPWSLMWLYRTRAPRLYGENCDGDSDNLWLYRCWIFCYSWNSFLRYY